MKVSTKIQFDVYDVLPSVDKSYPLVQVYPHGRTSKTSTVCGEDIFLPLPFVLRCLRKMYNGENLAKKLVSISEGGKTARCFDDLYFTLKGNLPQDDAIVKLLALNALVPKEIDGKRVKVKGLDVFTIESNSRL